VTQIYTDYFKLRDFTIKKYKLLLITLLEEGYKFISVEQAIKNIKNIKYQMEDKIVINRHDIDTKYDLSIAREMAKFEYDYGIRSSYYFRTVPETLDIKVIQQMAYLGHEIGYHYEIMSLAKGNEQKAIERFERDLEILRQIYPVKTICQHGGAMGHYNTTSIKGLSKIGWDYLRGKIKKIEYFNSLLLWDKYKLEEFGIIGDAYLSIDFQLVKYFSDTGQRWDSFSTRILDTIDEGKIFGKISARTTNDLIRIIKSGKVKKLNILVHPANWHDNYYYWLKWRLLQKFRNSLKKIYKPKIII